MILRYCEINAHIIMIPRQLWDHHIYHYNTQAAVGPLHTSS